MFTSLSLIELIVLSTVLGVALGVAGVLAVSREKWKDACKKWEEFAHQWKQEAQDLMKELAEAQGAPPASPNEKQITALMEGKTSFPFRAILSHGLDSDIGIILDKGEMIRVLQYFSIHWDDNETILAWLSMRLKAIGLIDENYVVVMDEAMYDRTYGNILSRADLPVLSDAPANKPA